MNLKQFKTIYKIKNMFSDAKSDILLFQTDTTVGLASQDAVKLSEIKVRHSHKQFLKIYSKLSYYPHRIPSKFKNSVRRSTKTTFIVKNRAFRIAKPLVNSTFLNKYRWYYSTSANRSGASFNREFCENVADVIIEDKNNLLESSPSRLYKINNSKLKVLR